MKFILGKKLEMGQKFDEQGMVIPVTKVQAGPCTVTQIKTENVDGYTSVQVGFGEKRHLTKALAGHLKDLTPASALREFRLTDAAEAEKVKRGDTITAAIFEKGEIVCVSGTSKGKGFQGVVRRHGFAGGKAAHGNKDQLRMPGSLGAKGPAHVFKGTRMGGRMGGGQVTVTNLQIVDIDAENNILYIKGAVPGGRNAIISISSEGALDLTKQTPPQTETPVETPVATEVSANEKPAAEASTPAAEEKTEMAQSGTETEAVEQK